MSLAGNAQAPIRFTSHAELVFRCRRVGRTDAGSRSSRKPGTTALGRTGRAFARKQASISTRCRPALADCGRESRSAHCLIPGLTRYFSSPVTEQPADLRKTCGSAALAADVKTSDVAEIATIILLIQLPARVGSADTVAL